MLFFQLAFGGTAMAVKKWYCGMCEQLFSKSGDCPKCGFQLEKWPS